MNRRMRKILTILLAAVFVVSTALFIARSMDSAKAEESHQSAEELAARPKEPAKQESVPEETEPAVPEVTEPQTMWVPAPVEPDEHMKKLADINLDALREVNPDVRGWIYLPNTLINYPIVQGEDNQHYLEFTWDNKKNFAGSIFLEATNAPDFSDFRSIVYGHNMANSTMFGSLHRYGSKDYWQQYPYVYLVTDEGVLRYDIYSCYKANIESATYVLELEEDGMKAAFIKLTKDESALETDITPAVTDRVLTLSTCVGNHNYRRVVHARLPMIEVEAEKDAPQE